MILKGCNNNIFHCAQTRLPAQKQGSLIKLQPEQTLFNDAKAQTNQIVGGFNSFFDITSIFVYKTENPIQTCVEMWTFVKPPFP